MNTVNKTKTSTAKTPVKRKTSVQKPVAKPSDTVKNLEDVKKKLQPTVALTETKQKTQTVKDVRKEAGLLLKDAMKAAKELSDTPEPSIEERDKVKLQKLTAFQNKRLDLLSTRLKENLHIFCRVHGVSCPSLDGFAIGFMETKKKITMRTLNILREMNEYEFGVGFFKGRNIASNEFTAVPDFDTLTGAKFEMLSDENIGLVMGFITQQLTHVSDAKAIELGIGTLSPTERPNIYKTPEQLIGWNRFRRQEIVHQYNLFAETLIAKTKEDFKELLELREI